MIVTISTDASYSYRHKVGAYAWWITCNLGRIRMSGPLNGNIINPTDAEMRCIVNALWFLSTCKSITPHVSKIYVNTDSTNAIYLFTNDTRNIAKYCIGKKKHQSVIKKYNHIRSNFLKKIDVQLYHVRAHTDNQDSKSYVNAWCDINAKKELSLILNNLTPTQK